MKHFGITIFSGLIFFIAAFLSEVPPLSLAHVSRETSASERYRETLTVKQGVSRDGMLAITKIPSAPPVPPRAKSGNHARTLRAFFAPNRGGVLTLYVESIKPHEYYSLAGEFTVLGDYPVLTWESETTLAFYGISRKGELSHYVADVHFVRLSEEPIDPTIPIPTKNIPRGDLLP